LTAWRVGASVAAVAGGGSSGVRPPNEMIKRFGFSYLLAAKGIGGVTATKGSYTVSPSQPAKKKRKHKAHKRK